MGRDIASRCLSPRKSTKEENWESVSNVHSRENGLTHRNLIEATLVMNIIGSGQHHHMTTISLTGCIPSVKSSCGEGSAKPCMMRICDDGNQRACIGSEVDMSI